jgi:hypothetical protein
MPPDPKNRATSTQPVADPKATDVVAAASEPESYVGTVDPVMRSFNYTEPPDVGDPNAGLPEEEEKKEPPAIATVQGYVPVPRSQAEQATAAIYSQTLKEANKLNLLNELQYYVTEDEAMADAQELLESNYAAGSQLIGGAIAEYKQRTKQIEDDLREYRNTSIDPNRIFGNMTGAGRFAAALNVAVGQMASSGTGGPNAALGLLESAIERDILAQQNNSNILLNAIQQGRQLRSEDWDVAKDMVAEKEKLRAMAYAAIRQRLEVAKGQVRTTKARRNLEMLDVVVAGKESEARIAQRQAMMNVIFNGPIKSARHFDRLMQQYKQMAASYQDATRVPEGQGLTQADLPAFAGGGQAPAGAPQPPAEAAAPEQMPQTPSSTTGAVMAERRQRRAAVGAPTRGEMPAEPMEGAQETEVSAAAEPTDESPNPLTPEELAASEGDFVTPEVPELPAVVLKPGERVAEAMGKLPPQSERARAVDGNLQSLINGARGMWQEWTEKHKPPVLTEEEIAQMSASDKKAYEDYKDYYNWVYEHPALFERPFISGPLDKDKYTNYVRIDGLAVGDKEGKYHMFPIRQDAVNLRQTAYSKRGGSVDKSEMFNTDLYDVKVATRNASEAADLIKEVGITGRASIFGGDMEFRVENVYDEQGNVVDTKILGLSQEKDARAIEKVRELRTLVVGMAAKFVKAFDQTSRLSDQDMKLAMQTLGFSNLDTFVTGVLNAIGSGNAALVEGYRRFMANFASYAQKDFRLKWGDRGVIFPMETERSLSAEDRTYLQNLQGLRQDSAEADAAARLDTTKAAKL